MGHSFADISLLQHALAHRSWCGEQEGGAPSNERLEFLGDAVLGLAVARYTYATYPDFPEGMLAKVRSAVVNARVLAEVADRLRVGEVLLLGRGEEASGGRNKASILADAFEAVLGAIYLVGVPAIFGTTSTIQFLTSGLGLLAFILYLPGGLSDLLHRFGDLVTMGVERLGHRHDDERPLPGSPEPTLAVVAGEVPA